MAGCLGHLGLIYEARGDLKTAEELLRKSLKIDEEIGHKFGMATHYSNLGNIFRKRGDADGAEKMHRKSLAISEKLGRKDAIAASIANLGFVCAMRKDFHGAREYWVKSRDLYAKIGLPRLVKRLQGLIDKIDEAFAKSAAGAPVGGEGREKPKAKDDAGDAGE